MELVLSTNSHLNTILSNAAGLRMYKIETNTGFTMSRTTTISKFSSGADSKDSEDTAPPLGVITWHWFTSSKLHFNGEDVDIAKWMPASGTWGQHRHFKAPDGRSLVWNFSWDSLDLELDNESKTSIARFHPEGKGADGSHRNARLEIFPGGEGIVDAIVVTFVILEKVRKETTGKAGHGPGAPYLFSKPNVAD